VDIEKRRSEAENAMAEPCQRMARPGDYGFCAYGDAPPAIGGGMQFFYWFEDKQATLDFLRDHGVFLHPERSDIDLSETDSGLGREMANADRNDLESLRTQLNELLVGISQIPWIGSFEELRAGSHPEARIVRNHFRSENDQPEDGAAIRDEEIGNFAEFLTMYGV
jgi:hypothetical protein